jgi:hypothetical protein
MEVVRGRLTGGQRGRPQNKGLKSGERGRLENGEEKREVKTR